METDNERRFAELYEWAIQDGRVDRPQHNYDVVVSLSYQLFLFWLQEHRPDEWERDEVSREGVLSYIVHLQKEATEVNRQKEIEFERNRADANRIHGHDKADSVIWTIGQKRTA